MDETRAKDLGPSYKGNKMKKTLTFLKDYAIGLSLGAALLIAVVFGTSILTNLHNGYIRLLGPTVVKLTNAAGNSGATGFVMKGASGKKYIITNAHVCGLAENGQLVATEKNEQFQVNVVKKYIFSDLCALESRKSLGLAAHVASSVSIGETVYAIGHPLLEPKRVTSGEISGTMFVQVVVGENVPPSDCDGPTYELIDTSKTMYALLGINNICVRTVNAYSSSVPTAPGSSGSPIVNIYGSVVAVNFAGNQYGSSYFVTLEDLKDFLSEL